MTPSLSMLFRFLGCRIRDSVTLREDCKTNLAGACRLRTDKTQAHVGADESSKVYNTVEALCSGDSASADLFYQRPRSIDFEILKKGETVLETYFGSKKVQKCLYGVPTTSLK